jgi:hypothetical protein
LDSLGSVQKKTFTTLSVRGLDIPFKVKFVPPEAFYKPVDGSSRTNYQGFQRIIQVELGAINSDEDFIRAFFQAATKSFAYQGSLIVSEECQVTYESPSFEDAWFDEYKYTKKYIFELTENTVRTEWPTPIQPVVADIMYIKLKVKIEGMNVAPETFITNSGKLQYNYGTTPFPGISLLSYIVTIISNGAPYQDAKINQVGNVTQSGSNISFQLAVSDTGNPSSDGFFYADISIALQQII